MFPIPEICEYLTEETKESTYNCVERDEQGGKVSDFFGRHEDMFAEMKWQKKLRCRLIMYMVLNVNFYVPELRSVRFWLLLYFCFMCFFQPIHCYFGSAVT